MTEAQLTALINAASNRPSLEVLEAIEAAARYLETLKPVEDPDDLIRFWYGRKEVASGSYANEPCDWTIYAQSRAGEWYIGHVATLAWTDSWVPCGAPKHRLGNELKPQTV
jgi:hypothetical protein